MADRSRIDVVFSVGGADAQDGATCGESLGAAWVNHECASKQFAGYSFGTYLPPLFTRAAAEVTAANAVRCQRVLNQCAEAAAAPQAPLLLLELPPLTYFSFGDLAAAEFFAAIAQAAPCGFVLDIGHLWTMWRYGERARTSLEAFTETFLEAFPLDRVIQVHLAGLASAHYTLPPATYHPRPSLRTDFAGDAPFSHDTFSHDPDESDVPRGLMRTTRRFLTFSGVCWSAFWLTLA